MKRHGRSIAALALLLGACARPPLAELDQAWRSYQNASTAGAADRDPQRFQEAGSALVEGQDWIDQGDFEQARDALKRARRLADASAGGGPAPAPVESGFTEAPPTREGVQLSPLLESRGGARAAPAEPAPEAVPGAPSTPAAIEPPPVPPSAVPAPLPEQLEPTPAAEPPDAAEAAPRAAATPEETARAIRAERERRQRAADQSPAEEEPALQPEPPAADREVAPVPPAAPSASSRTYLVHKGDSLRSIARSQYRNEQAWTLIYAANRDRLESPEDVRAGMRLVLPPASTPIPSPRAVSPASSGGSTYTVRKGDTLHSIAKKMYGSTTYWTLIRDANRAKVEGSGDVRAGTKLVIPPRPSGR